MSTYLCVKNNVPSGRIGYDNIRALETSFLGYHDLHNPKHKFSDLLSAISGLMKIRMTTASFQHIKVQQDNIIEYDKLNRISKMNIRIDWLAKMIGSTLIHEEKLIPPIVSNHSLVFFYISVQGRYIQ